MANPIWITSENVKFNGTLENAAVLKTSAGVRSLILWDDLSVEDQNILIDFVNAHGGTLPLAAPTSGYQTIDFDAVVAGGDSTGLNNVAAETAGYAVINIGGDKIGTDASGLSASSGTHGSQVANFTPTITGATSTGIVSTQGSQVASFSVDLTGGSASGLADDTAGSQEVNIGGATVGTDPTGLTADVPATAGSQVVNVGGAKVGGDATGLSLDTPATAGTQRVTFTVAKAGGDSTGLTNDVPATAGSQVVNVGGAKVGGDATGLTNDVPATAGYQTVTSDVGVAAGDTAISTDGTYYFKVAIDGGAATEYNITTSGPTTYTQVAAAMETAIGAVNATVSFDDANDRFLVTSATTGASSAIAITAGTTGTDVFAQIVTDGTPTTMTVNTAVAGTDVVVTTYTASISVDGVAKPISIGGGTAQTFTTLLAEINTDLGASATATLDAGNIKITSATTGTSSTIVITDTDLFSSLTGYVALIAPVDGTNVVVTTYTASIDVDGVTKPISVDGGTAQTFTDLLVELNTDLGASATATIDGSGYILVTSATTGATSAVAITDTTLFAALTNYSSIETAVAGTDITPVLYTASISVDGTPVAISIAGSAAQTFTDLLTELNTDLGASATATLDAGNIKITSATTGASSTVAITDTNLFSSLTGYVALVAPVAGTDIVVTTYTASISVDGTPVAISIDGGLAQTFTDLLVELNTDLGASATAAIVGGNILITSATTGAASAVVITDTDLFSSLTGYIALVAPVAGTHTTYTASISVDGVAKSISFGGNVAQTITDVLAEINTDLGASAVAAIDANGDIKVTSATYGSTSTVAITDTNLFSSLSNFTALATAVAGTGSGTALTASISVDGGAHPISILPHTIPTFTDVVNAINTALGGTGVASVAGGDLKVTSNTYGISSTVSISIGTLFPALAGFSNILPPQNGGGSSVKYSATVTVDGVIKTVSFTGLLGDTIQHVLDEINTDLGASATATLDTGNIKITSATTGLTSNVSVYDSGFLFSSLTDYAGITSTAGTAPVVYTASIWVDGVEKAIAVQGSAAQTFTDLLAEVNVDLAASAIAAIDANGNITVTSASTGLTSTVSIVDGTLFKSITGTTLAPRKVVNVLKGVSGIADLLDAFSVTRTPNGTQFSHYFDVIAVGTKPAVPAVPAILPKLPQFTYWDGTNWLYLADDTAV